MWEKKYPILGAVLVVLVFIGVYYGFVIEKTKQDQMLDALSDHDHEKALIFASKLLEEEPSNKDAKKIIQESGQIFFYLQAAQSTLSQFSSAETNPEVKAETIYEGLKKAKEYAAKAKALDPRFKNSRKFEESLDDAQRDLMYVLAMNVIESGHGSVSAAVANYQKTSAILDSAASYAYLSAFLSVQSAWGLVDQPVDKIKQEINPDLEKIEDTGRLVSDYHEESAGDFSESLLTYIQVARKTVDILSMPRGSYDTFTKTASDVTTEYQEARNKLKRSIPRSLSSETGFSNLVKALAKYKIFQNDSIAEIMNSNQSLYEL